VHELNANSSAIEREFYDFYRTLRGEFTPEGQSPKLTTHPTLTSNVKFMKFLPVHGHRDDLSAPHALHHR
jgi:hypothetical protein